MIDAYCVSGALCGEALEFLEPLPEGGSKRGLGWRLKFFPFASLGSFAGVGWLRYVGALACFALIRRWRDTFPTRGKAATVIPLRLETAFELRRGGIKVSTVRPPSSVASRHLPPRRGRLFWLCVALCGASWQARSRLLAPRQGGGVRLRGAVWLCRSPLHPVCRFAQDDTWVTGA